MNTRSFLTVNLINQLRNIQPDSLSDVHNRAYILTMAYPDLKVLHDAWGEFAMACNPFLSQLNRPRNQDSLAGVQLAAHRLADVVRDNVGDTEVIICRQPVANYACGQPFVNGRCERGHQL